MKKLKTANVGKAREVYARMGVTLYHTTKGAFVMVNQEGDEVTLSPEDAASTFGFSPRESEFYCHVHNPGGDLGDPDAPQSEDDIEFGNECDREQELRFEEILQSAELQTCVLEFVSMGEIINLKEEDHIEILRIHRQTSETDFPEFESELPDTHSKWMEGHLKLSQTKSWDIKYWYDSMGAIQSSIFGSVSLPHVWVYALGTAFNSDEEKRSIINHAVCSIIECQLSHERYYGRDLNVDLKIPRFAGNPNVFRKCLEVGSSI